MTVTCLGDAAQAELACRSIFGENADLGPVRLAPELLLQLKDKWPGRTDEPLNFALQLPYRFDINHDMAKGHGKAVQIRACLVTVIHEGKDVGRALRMDAASLGSVAVWERAWLRHRAMAAH